MSKNKGYEISGVAYKIAPNSKYEIQKASFGRRFLAFIIDLAILLALATFVNRVVSKPIVNNALGYSAIEAKHDQNILEFGFARIDPDSGKVVLINFALDEEKDNFEALIQRHGPDLVAANLGTYDEEEGKYVLLGDIESQMNKLKRLLYLDGETEKLVNKMTFLKIVESSFSIFVSLLLVYLLVPLLFKNGQTLGKKLIRLAIISKSGLTLKPINYILRVLVGFYLIEIVGLIILYNLAPTLALYYFIAMIAVIMFTKNNRSIHDLISGTVCVDLDAQYLIDTFEEKATAQKEEYRQYIQAQRQAKK